MVRTASVSIGLCLLLISLGPLGIFASNGEFTDDKPATSYVVDQGGSGDFTTIMGAVNAAQDGDDILVTAGTYNEQVSIVKNGISLIGSGPGSTIINPGSGNTGIGIMGNWINLSGFTILSTVVGISMGNSNNCHIDNIETNSNSNYGFEIITSSYCNLSNSNTGFNTFHGVRINGGHHLTLYNNSIYENSQYGIWFYNTINNEVIKNRINNSYIGVKLEINSNRNEFHFNNISSNSHSNIESSYSDDLIFKSNLITNGGSGAHFTVSPRSIWDGNTFSGSFTNINMNQSGSMRFVNNTVNHSQHGGFILLNQSGDHILNNDIFGTLVSGLDFVSCRDQTLMDNSFMQAGIIISGDHLDNWNTHYIDTTNTVNGKAIRFYKNQVSGNVGQNAGQIILANCSRLNIADQDITSTNMAVQIGFSDRITISDSKFSTNFLGLYLLHTSDTLIDNITVLDNQWKALEIYGGGSNIIRNSYMNNGTFGIIVRGSSNNEISNNSIMDIETKSLSLARYNGLLCENNVVRGNNISHGDFGIDLDGTVGTRIEVNQIEHNEIVGINIGEAYPSGPSSETIVTGNNITKNGEGIIAGRGSHNNMISDNQITHNKVNGIVLMDIIDTIVMNNYIHNQTEIGVTAIFVDNVTIDGNYVANNTLGGVILEDSDRSTISNNTMIGLANQIEAISVNSLADSKIHSNYILNHSVGISAYNSMDLTFYNNYFDNDVNIGSISSSSNLKWNISKTNGTNILGGDMLGGNYWNDYAGLDLDGDWFGDQLLPHGPGDFLPLQFDLIPPTLVDNTSAGIAFTGESYNFSVHVNDERVPASAKLDWWIEEGPVHEMDMIQDMNNLSRFDVTTPIPEDMIGTVSYKFTAFDGGNNQGSINGTGLIVVMDNIKPKFISNSYQETVLIGIQNQIDVVVKDNIEVSLVRLFYIDVDGNEYSLILESSGEDIYSGIIPGQGGRGTVTFWFTAIDSTGSSNRSEDLSYRIIDDIPPMVEFLSPSNETIISDGIQFLINVTDPVGEIKNVIVTVKGPVNAELYNRTPSTEVLTLDWDTSALFEGTYLVTLTATDDIGNIASTHIVIIVDHTLPTPVINGSINTFVDMVVKLDAYLSDDQYGITSYRWGEGEWSLNALDTNDGPEVEFIFREPGDHNVWLEVVDRAGNLNWTQVTINVFLPPGPRVVITSPANGQTGVLIDSDVQITFDMPMNRSSIERNIEIVPFEPHTYRWDNSSKVLTIIVPGGFDHETLYTVKIKDASAADSRVSKLGEFTINFTTEDSPPPPSIIITSPTTNGDYYAGMTMTVSGVSYYLKEGTVLTIRIEDKTWNAEVDEDSEWRVDLILPQRTGSYRVTVEGGGASSEITIEVKNAPKNKSSISESLIFFIVSMILLILLIVGYVIWKKNRDKEFLIEEEWEE